MDLRKLPSVSETLDWARALLLLHASHLDVDIVRDSLNVLLKFEADRAREFYGAAQRLLPLIDEDSQPALWTLVEIYRRLLEKIAARNYDVFGERVRLTTWEKIRVLARGLWMRLT